MPRMHRSSKVCTARARITSAQTIVGTFQVESGHRPEVLHHQYRIDLLRVDPGAHGRATDVHGAKPCCGLHELGTMTLDRMAVCGELLTEPDRRGILQVRTSGLQH